MYVRVRSIQEWCVCEGEINTGVVCVRERSIQEWCV